MNKSVIKRGKIFFETKDILGCQKDFLSEPIF